MDVVADQTARKMIMARAAHQITRVEATERPVIAVTAADFVPSVRARIGFAVVTAPDQVGAASVTAVMAAPAELVIAQAWDNPADHVASVQNWKCAKNPTPLNARPAPSRRPALIRLAVAPRVTEPKSTGAQLIGVIVP